MINNNEKISLEIEILTQQINVFEDKIKQLEAKLNKFQSQKREVKIEADIKDAEKELSKLQLLINKLGISEKNLQTYKKFGDILAGLAVKIKDMGKEFIDEALNIKGYENAIIRLSESTEKGKKTIDFINKLAVSSQEFSLESLYVAGKHLKNFKLDVEKLLPLISDFADVYGVDVSKASLMFSKALVGTRGGLTTLMTQFGITREELKKFGAEFTKQGVIVPQSIKSIEAVMKLLVEYSKKAGKQSQDSAEQFENAVAKYNNSIQLTKIAIGKELLPVVSSLLEKIAQLTLKFSEMSIEQKKTIANITLLAGGAVLTGQAITLLIPVVNGLKIAYTALSAAIIANPISAIAIGIGAVIYSLEEWYKEQQKLKQAKIEEDLKPVAKELSNINNIINEINNKKLSIDTSKIKAQIEDLRNDSRELQISEQGNKPFFIQSFDKNQTVVSITNPYRIDKIDIENGEKLSSVYQKINGIYEGIIDKEKNGTELTEKEKQAKIEIENLLRQIDISLSGFSPKQDEYNKKLDDTKQKIENISPAIKKLSNDINNAFSALTAGLNTAADKFADKANSKTGEKPSFSAGKDNTDDQRLQALQKKFNYHKDLQKADKESQSQYLSWLNEFKGKYKFTNEELLQIDVEVQTAKDKINQYNKKQADKAEKDREQALKKEEDDFKTEYNIFKKSLDEKLKYGKITSDDYVKQTLKFAKDHQKFITPELGDEMNLRNQEVFDKHNQELLKQKEEEGRKLEENQKKQEALQEKKKAAELEITRIITENSNQTADLQQDNNNDTAENFIANKKKELNSLESTLAKKIEYFKDAGIEEVKISEFIASEKKKLEAEVLKDFKEKEKEKQSIISDTKDEIEKLDKELEELKAKKNALSSKSSFLFGDEANPLKTAEEAFSSSFNGHIDNYQAKFEEEKNLDSQIKTIEDQKSQLQLKELEASQALATLKQNEAIATGEVVTALQNFSGALNDASSSSGSGGAGGPSGDSESDDSKGFQNTYSGTMQDIKNSSGDSTLNNPVLSAGDSKNNKKDNAQIGDYTYSSGAIGAGAGAGIKEQQEQRKKKSKKRLQDYMNSGAGGSGNMPSDEVYGNIPQNIEEREGWGNPSLDKEMQNIGGKWAVKNMRLAISKSSEDLMTNFLQGAVRRSREVNRSLTNNTYNNNRSNSETNNNQNIVIHFDNKQTQNITSSNEKRKVNDFISMALAAKTLR